ncbi:MAG: pyridoxamine 5'-phosphate oxidase family protein [Desulfovibrio sp.]|jgi:nitroimidazol reductase NimA-like FMN-containing flavoprotein (pyridoxamine 5'-phosphate oxidase superfamily)|nr:pyridoxamine 5'-phosphate oxidase family protein [Desulfovibrio sp.]
MRRKEREMREPAFMHGVLADARQMCLAVNAGGAPYIVAVNHVFYKSALWFHCAAEGRKLDLLRADPRLGFFAAVDIAQDGTTTRYRSVYGTGRAEIIHDAGLKRDILKAIAGRFEAPCRFPVSPEALAVTAIVRIEIETLTGKHSRRGEGPNAALKTG